MACLYVPARWRDRDRLVILEAGFGLGLNFLLTWQAWRNDPGRSRQLHFVSVEKFPFWCEDLQRLHAVWPHHAALSDKLLRLWPDLTGGQHELFWMMGGCA